MGNQAAELRQSCVQSCLEILGTVLVRCGEATSELRVFGSHQIHILYSDLPLLQILFLFFSPLKLRYRDHSGMYHFNRTSGMPVLAFGISPRRGKLGCSSIFFETT